MPSDTLSPRRRGPRWPMGLHLSFHPSILPSFQSLLARGADGDRGAAAGRRTSPGSADGSHFPAAPPAAKKLIAAIGFEPRHSYSRRHLDTIQNLSRSRIDPPQITPIIIPSTVPEFSIVPGHPCYETAGFNCAENRPGFGIDLIDLPVLILRNPKRPFGPREPRAIRTRHRDRCKHTTGLWIDLLDPIVGDLKQVLAIEGRSRMRSD